MPHTAVGEETLPGPLTTLSWKSHFLCCLFTYNLEDKETMYCWRSEDLPPHLLVPLALGLYFPEAPFSTLWP